MESFQKKVVAAFPKIYLSIDRVDIRREKPRNDQSVDFEWNLLSPDLLLELSKIGIPRAKSILGEWIVNSIKNFVVQKQQYKK